MSAWTRWTAAQEDAWARDWIASVIARCPRRQCTTVDEWMAQQMVEDTWAELGVPTERQMFRFGRHLYANLLLHFGVSAVASVGLRGRPGLSSAIQALVAASYTAETLRTGPWLRRLLPSEVSSNVLATLPSLGPRRLRIVLISHIDAAFTGLLFQPAFVQRFGPRPGARVKPMQLVVGAGLLLAALDALRALGAKPSDASPGTAWNLVRGLLTVPAAVTALMNLDVVLRDTVVPGANDNLSGVAGGFLLARRLLDARPEGVEFVFVSAGAEEASLGGSDALCRAMAGRWDRSDTVVLATDGFSNGELFWFEEGEIVPMSPAPWLHAVLEDLASRPEWAGLAPLPIPVGGTDAVPFLVRGWDAVAVGTADPRHLAPAEYHLPTDDVAHLWPDRIPRTVDLVEALIEAIVRSHPRHPQPAPEENPPAPC
jgi:hypothetical protein